MFFSSLKIALTALVGILFLLSGTACSGSDPVQATELKNDVMALIGDADRGAVLFAQPVLGDPPAPGCINCHGTTTEVELVGPSLPALSDISTGYLLTSIVDPNAAFAKGVRQGGMFNFYDESLSAQEIADLIAYLQVAHGEVE